MGLGRVKTQRRANCREKYFFGGPFCEREEHTELRRRGIREADSLPFAGLNVFTQPGASRKSHSARCGHRAPPGSSSIAATINAAIRSKCTLPYGPIKGSLTWSNVSFTVCGIAAPMSGRCSNRLAWVPTPNFLSNLFRWLPIAFGCSHSGSRPEIPPLSVWESRPERGPRRGLRPVRLVAGRNRRRPALSVARSAAEHCSLGVMPRSQKPIEKSAICSKPKSQLQDERFWTSPDVQDAWYPTPRD